MSVFLYIIPKSYNEEIKMVLDKQPPAPPEGVSEDDYHAGAKIQISVPSGVLPTDVIQNTVNFFSQQINSIAGLPNKAFIAIEIR